MSWTQPKCEKCWIRDETTLLPDGGATIRRPFLMKEPEVEACAFCGDTTIIGLYVRVNPATVPFPTLDNEEEAK